MPRTDPADHPLRPPLRHDDPARPRTGYPRKRARTRRQLMDAGVVVLARTGREGATVGEVAREARVSPATFYNHFSDLDELTDAVVDDLAAAVEIGRELLTAVEHDPAARVAIGTRQLLDLAGDDPSTAQAFVTLLATVPAFRRRVRATVAGAVEAGIAEGRFTRQPVEVVVDALIGAVTQWIRTRLAGETDDAGDIARLTLALRIAGLATDDATEVVAGALAHA
jgi:AcrR family transcriptional regulator